MKQRIAKPPMTRRSFSNPWSELDYLCQKLRYWLYTRRQKTKATRYLTRLDRVLRSIPNSGTAILREEGLAILCELKGRISEAIAHRRREILLMERLHREAQTSHYSEPTRAYMLRDRDDRALRVRRAILDALQTEYSPGLANTQSALAKNLRSRPRQIARRGGQA